MARQHWILMADVVDSRKRSGTELSKSLHLLVRKVNLKFSGQILSPLTITLGDEFQGIVKSMEAGLNIISFMELSFLTQEDHYHLRYVLHQGEVETALNRQNAHGMLGSGLTEARAILNAAKSGRRSFVVSGKDVQRTAIATSHLQVFMDYLDAIPEKDRAVANRMLREADYRKVAAAIGKDPSSVFRKRRTLRIEGLQALLKGMSLMYQTKEHTWVW